MNVIEALAQPTLPLDLLVCSAPPPSFASDLTITVTGAQGSGKTTTADIIADALRGAGFSINRKQDGHYVGGSICGGSRKRVTIDEVQTRG